MDQDGFLPYLLSWELKNRNIIYRPSVDRIQGQGSMNEIDILFQNSRGYGMIEIKTFNNENSRKNGKRQRSKLN